MQSALMCKGDHGTVLILDVNSEMGAHVRSNSCYLICLRHLIRLREVTKLFFLSEKTFFPSCLRNLHFVTI